VLKEDERRLMPWTTYPFRSSNSAKNAPSWPVMPVIRAIFAPRSTPSVCVILRKFLVLRLRGAVSAALLIAVECSTYPVKSGSARGVRDAAKRVTTQRGATSSGHDSLVARGLDHEANFLGQGGLAG